MDKYDKHLQFLIEALPEKGAEHCTDVFLNQAKRDVRKALFFLFKPEQEEDELLSLWESVTEKEDQLEILRQCLHSYCPNESYTKVVGALSKGKPFRIDTATLPKLKNFRRAPRKETLQQWFKLVQGVHKDVLVALLKGVQPFGRELEPLWATIDAHAYHPDKEVIKASLNLLARMPTGVQKSIMTFSRYLNHPEARFYALSAMNRTTGLSDKLLIGLFNPILTEYRKLASTKGAMNDMWEEFRLIQSILKNNGVRLSIPDISLGRF